MKILLYKYIEREGYLFEVKKKGGILTTYQEAHIGVRRNLAYCV